MATLTTYDYHYGSEADQYTFYRLPKALYVSFSSDISAHGHLASVGASFQ